MINMSERLRSDEVKSDIEGWGLDFAFATSTIHVWGVYGKYRSDSSLW